MIDKEFFGDGSDGEVTLGSLTEGFYPTIIYPYDSRLKISKYEIYVADCLVRSSEDFEERSNYFGE